MNNEKTLLKPIGTYVLIKSEGEEKKSQILSVDDVNKESYRNHRQWIDKKNTVVAVGELVESLKPGDVVYLDNHAPLKKIEELTKLFSEKCNIKVNAERVIDGKVMEGVEVELVKYCLIDIKHIIGVLDIKE